VKKANARPKARNPRTGEIVYVPARRKVRFRPGKVLKGEFAKPTEMYK
jgi:nucleoid DNA-binding protein